MMKSWLETIEGWFATYQRIRLYGDPVFCLCLGIWMLLLTVADPQLGSAHVMAGIWAAISGIGLLLTRLRFGDEVPVLIELAFVFGVGVLVAWVGKSIW